MFTWLTGMPTKVHGRVATLHHDIEVEDTASAPLTYANGGTGQIATNTWEFPGESMVRVVGSKGMLAIDGRDTLRLARCNPPSTEFARNSKEVWVTPKAEWETIPVEADTLTWWQRAGKVTENFAHSIRDGRALVAPGAEGGKSLELSNAITLSSHLGEEVELPIDRGAYDRLLKERIQAAKAKK